MRAPVIYNTLTRKKEPLPEPGASLRMFVCGPTVYDYSHIGHARTYIFYDTFVRYLRHGGYKVFYLQNITDIDDKIIARANESKRNPLKLARELTDAYYEDMQALGITSVNKYAPATEYIPQIVSQVKRLVDKGFAYRIENDGYYFDLTKSPEYGKLSGRTVEAAEDALSRIDESINKRNKGDFALWKLSKPGEPSWDTELGKGRPGWHIEDTAITETEFGPQYDLHGGALELMFPHHEAEIAQMEAISGKTPMVKYWVHAGVLTIGGKKMAKSLGNFITIRDLLKNHALETVRFYLLSGHYRSPMDFSDQGLSMSRAGIENLKNVIERMGLLYTKGALSKGEKIVKKLDQYWQEIRNRLDDDFNTPEAFGVLSGFISELNQAIDNKSLDSDSYAKAKQILSFIDEIFGIIPNIHMPLPEEIERLIKERETLRQKKDWAGADTLRSQIEHLGYTIDDTPYGPLVKKRS